MARAAGQASSPPPVTTALGGLLHHITGGAQAATFQPMNINFGLLPPLAQKVKRPLRKTALAKRALADLDGWLALDAQAA